MIDPLHRPNYERMTDRDLLIRIDERQHFMSAEVNKWGLKTKELEDKLDKKVSKSSITWFITIIGGGLGILSTIAVVISSISEKIIK